MKHIRITLSLLVVVVLAMAGIFFVEGVTTPIIEARLSAQANAALYEMFGVDPESPGSYILEEVTEQYPEDDAVSKVWVMSEGGSQVGVIYQAETAGINPGIQFLFALNSETNQSVALSILANSETAGIGKDWLEDQAILDQYANVSLDLLKGESIDTTAGVTLTGTGVNNGIKKVLVYHGVNFLGEEAPETPEEMVIRVKSEWLGGAGNDVYGNYEANDYITEVLEGNGTYVITGIYVGFEQSEVSSYMMAFNGTEILGFVSIETFETVGIGQTLVEDPLFAAQFEGADVEAFKQTGADYVSGSTASYTLDGINESVLEVIDFYQKQVLGIQDEEAPVITINESRPTTFEVGSAAPDWSIYAEATDNDELATFTNDGDAVDFNTAGTYTITFTATDAAGNIATAELTVEITDAPVEFVLVPVPAEIQTVLETMDASTTDFHDEGIVDGLIQGVYTGRDAEGNILSVFYNVQSDNGSWTGNNVNSIMVQFAPGSTTIEAVNVFINSATYFTSDFAPNYNVGENLDSPIIAAAWAGINGTGQVTETDLDTVSGTTAEESFPSMIESIEAVLVYQIDNSIGGAS